MTASIRRAAVIGAGTMGAQIAAHFANCGIPAVLLDILPSELTAEESARELTLEVRRCAAAWRGVGWSACAACAPTRL